MPAVPTSPTIYDGVLPSSLLNQFRDAINFLQSPPLAEIRQTSGQSINNATWTAITFDTEDIDTDIAGLGGHTGSDSQWVARYSGWYQVSGGVGWVANGTGARGTLWSINGTFLNATQILLPALSGLAGCYPARTKHAYLSENDYIELYAYQSSGGALNTSGSGGEQSHMSIRWVSR